VRLTTRCRSQREAPLIGDGCVGLGILDPLQPRMVTVAKWQDGAIAEEYIWS